MHDRLLRVLRQIRAEADFDRLYQTQKTPSAEVQAAIDDRRARLLRIQEACDLEIASAEGGAPLETLVDRLVKAVRHHANVTHPLSSAVEVEVDGAEAELAAAKDSLARRLEITIR